VPLFRRGEPLHRRLADEAGLPLDGDPPPRLDASPPGWDSRSAISEPAFHGIPRPRRWELVVPAEAPRVRGDAVHFVTLPDGTVVVDEDEPDEAVTPLAEAVEATLEPPYRAEAVRRDGSSWTVGASRVRIVEQDGLDGDEVELTAFQGNRTLVLDGRRALQSARALEAVGRAVGGEDYVVRASRIDGDLWEVEATPL
jgi:hypothetical protein